MAPEAQDYVESLALTPPDAPLDRWRSRAAPYEISSAAELLSRLANDGTIISMAQLATARSELRVPYDFHPWSRSFNLVVGDSLTDRISFWNGRLLYEPWQQLGLTTMRVPEALLNDDLFTQTLGVFIGRRLGQMPGEASGQGRITIRSFSVESDRLESLKARLGKFAQTAQMETATIGSSDDCVPPLNRLREERYRLDSQPIQFASETKFSLEVPRPRHFVDDAPVPPSFRRGHWAVDLRIERHISESHYSNVSHWWQLPRRFAMVRAFLEGSLGRVTIDGEIAFVQEDSIARKELSVPGDDLEAVRHLFLYSQPQLSGDLRSQVDPTQAFAHTEPGDKGRYLIGALGLFGSLATGFEILSDRYWQALFVDMAAPAKSLPSEKINEIERRLKKELKRHGTETVTSGNDWQALVEAAIKVVPGAVKIPRPIIGYAKLLQRRKLDLEAIFREDPSAKDFEEEVLAGYETETAQAITEKCQSGVFAQGHKWRCHRCGHRNWNSVSEISATLQCDVCGSITALPAHFEWDFYLNDLLAEGLREHGLLGTIWALGEIQRRAKNSFFFAPPLSLYREFPESRRTKPDAELDICCSIDGRFTIGEVKESGREMSSKLGDNLLSLAREIQPDHVIIACMDRGAQSEVTQEANRIEGALKDIHCSVEAMVPSPYFNSGRLTLR